jgi:hypothetical protein
MIVTMAESKTKIDALEAMKATLTDKRENCNE